MFLLNILVLVSLLGVGLHLNGVASMTHSLMYFHTSSNDVPNFPEYISVGYVNGLQITHYDSNTKRTVPKQEWMKKITEEDPQYWDTQTQINLGGEQVIKGNTEVVKQRLNQTEGSHIHQWMSGCEWDDETGDINGWYQYGFDGEDFIIFDLKTETFVAPRSEAVPSKHKWESTGVAERYKDYITRPCVEYLKKHVRNGNSTLMRKELPRVSFLQKTPSSPVTCHATGFYPDRAMLFWTKDGVELHEGVDPGEILPNHDGTFQMSVDLDMSHLSSVPPEDWGHFECMFQLSGVPDMPTKLHPDLIMTNAKQLTPRK
ncbi:class I histocompatibility antigen, F10 alpha chain-like [Boleophthalmus pectinirostris]|uniref:class I histocompatibility antigen, F10 alpha chain-like n=1 Tax=Boleophthalmus pectinirostris TaxID=150288 RepID=UPI00242E2355|nr:class I histocompatibility antigen, F10 alpha chain-like [Boleophthalmus pectinirostris]